MEWSGMSYIDILQMPVQALTDYADWKLKYDEETRKAEQKAIESIRSMKRPKR